MKRFIAFALIATACMAAASCGEKCAQPGEDRTPAAVINGETITMGELNSVAKDQLARVETEVYQIKKAVLDSLIEEKIIAAEAREKGLGVDEYLAQEINAKVTPPTDEEVKALYDARKGTKDKPFDEVKEQIRGYLSMNRIARARAELLTRLRSEASVRVELSVPRVEIDIEGEPHIGEGPVVITDFSDYQCPYSQMVRQTLWKLLDEYNGKLKYVFLDFPLSFHKDAKKAHEAARCAGEQDKYFEFNKKLFENQGKISLADLKALAKEMGLDTERFNQCLDNGTYAEAVEKSMARGIQAGVTGTPTFFINGIMLSGAQPYGSFKELIESEIKR